MRKEKEQFIFDWIKKNDGHIDTMNSYFIDDYIKIFKPKKIRYKMWGSHNVPELSKLLKQMYDEEKLERYIYSLCPVPNGFPKWVYSYHLKNDNKLKQKPISFEIES